MLFIEARFHSTTPPPLRVTELMYHPAEPSTTEIAAGFLDADAFEFLEIRNVGNSTTSLTGIQLTDGVTFDFETATITNFAPGARAVVVSNPLAFSQRYGTALPIIDTNTGSLRNSGERVGLTGGGGVAIHSFSYDDSWYPSTDGLGFSLEIIDDTQPTTTWDQGASWQTSDQSLGSPGAANGNGDSAAAPPIAISEINYHPPLGGYEYLEITNVGTAPVALFDPNEPTRTWQMTAGVRFTFPENLSLASGAHYLLVPFDPIVESATLEAFIALYNVPSAVGILGPYNGSLSNEGERVTLSQPGTPFSITPTIIPYTTVDSVTYDDTAPWPTAPDGPGASLDRTDLTSASDDPANWQAHVGGTAGNGPPNLFKALLQTYFSAADLADPFRYNDWADLNDSDQDGLDLLTEYYFDLNPTLVDADSTCTMTITENITYITYRRAKNIEGITLRLECSEDSMNTWITMPFADELISDEGSYQIRQATINEGTANRDSLFFQLRFSR